MKRNTLENKNCLIVGATGGLGTEITKQFVSQKCNLFLTGSNRKRLNKLVNEINISKNNLKIETAVGDLNKNQDIVKIINKVRKTFKKIDILVNCAGIFISKPINKCSLNDFDTLFNVNVKAPFLFCQEFSKDMKSKRWGRIVNVGSTSSYSGFKNGSIYCASKHALLGLSRSLNSELKEYNIRTFCFSPGSIKTKMGKLDKKQDYNTFLDPKEVSEFIINTITYDEELSIDEIILNRFRIQ